MDRIINLPTPVRLALFGIIAAAVLALGFLTIAPDRPDSTPASPAASPGGSASTGVDLDEEGSTVVGQDPDSAPEADPSVTDYTDGVALNLKMPVSERDLQTAAGRAVRFTELFQSYRYNQDPADKRRELERLLGQDNAIDVASIFPSGSLREAHVADRTEIAVRATRVEATMVSPSMLALSVTTEQVTRTKGVASAETERAYSLTLTREPGRSGWYVTEFYSATGDFQDENAG